jgi:phage/plasmid primase-like uncharacterized protein
VAIETEIARRGIKLRGGIDRCGPCPMCGGTDRFSINIKKQCFCCRGCQVGGDVIALVRHLDGVDFSTAIATLTGSVTGDRKGKTYGDDDVKRTKSALRLWHEAGPIEGSIGIVYLREVRRIFGLPPNVHDVLRFHPHCFFGRDEAGQWIFHPCIIALFRDVITDEPTGVHRIALDSQGKLISRKALGRKKGCAVKLWPDAEITTGLVVGEGIETVLAAAMHVTYRGTLLQPAWALVDAGNLEAFPVLPGIEHLTVLADADVGGRGQNASRTCARRWADAGRTAGVLIPNRLGDDFNDIARAS